MKFPCEISMWYVLPGIRSLLARELVTIGLSQKEASDKLGLTQASVSYYLNEKRGHGIKIGKGIKTEIKKLARDIKKGIKRKEINFRICEICKLTKKDKSLCKMHREVDEVPDDCDLCFI